MKKPLSSGTTPLTDDLSQPSYIRELLDAGRGARVSDYDVERGLHAHLSRVASGAPMPEWARSMQPAPSATAAAAAATAGKSVIGWVLAPALAVVVAATGTLVFLDAGQRPDNSALPVAPAASAPAPRAAAVTAGGSSSLATVETDSAAEPRVESHGVQPHAKFARSPSAPTNKSASTRMELATRGASTPRVSAPGSAAPVGVSSDPFASAVPAASRQLPVAAYRNEAHGEPAEAPAAEQPAPAAVQPVAKQAPVKGQLDDARLEREMGMLSMTERVLKSDPERALKLARQGEAEFAGSMFTQERQQLLLLALVKLDRVDEAKRLAKPYLARFPNGPFSDRVRRALASGKLDP